MSAVEQWLRGMVLELRDMPNAEYVIRFPWTFSNSLESAADEIKQQRERLADLEKAHV